MQSLTVAALKGNTNSLNTLPLEKLFPMITQGHIKFLYNTMFSKKKQKQNRAFYNKILISTLAPRKTRKEAQKVNSSYSG